MQLAIHVVQSRHAGEQKKHWDKTNKENCSFKLGITKGHEVRATTIEGQNSLLQHCASVLCLSFTRGVVKTRLIRLRVIESPYRQLRRQEGPNARDQIALGGFHSFLVEVQTNAGYIDARHA